MQILRLEPRLINNSEEPTEVGEEIIIDEKKEHPMADLTELYGTKKAKKSVSFHLFLYVMYGLYFYLALYMVACIEADGLYLSLLNYYTVKIFNLFCLK